MKFDLLASLRKCNELSTWDKITKQLAFLIISSTQSLEKIEQISSHSLWPYQLIVTVFRISTLSLGVVVMGEMDSMQNTCICTNDVRVHRFVCINARKSRWLLVHKDRMLGICNIVFYLNIDNSHVVNKSHVGK